MMSQDLDSKYFVSLAVLGTDVELQKTIKSTFHKRTKNKCIAECLSIEEVISFVDLEPFKEEILYRTDLQLEISDLQMSGQFRAKNYFKDQAADLFKGISKQSSELYVYFSKPVGNVLAIEIADLKRVSNGNLIKQGESLLVLFVFEKNGAFVEYLTKHLVYN